MDSHHEEDNIEHKHDLTWVCFHEVGRSQSEIPLADGSPGRRSEEVLPLVDASKEVEHEEQK